MGVQSPCAGLGSKTAATLVAAPPAVTEAHSEGADSLPSAATARTR
jgi:hypothetical protein